MNINWFPGHMAKSLRLIEESARLVDVIIYVLDARIPLSCLNPALDGLTGNKPVLYVLNKADLACDAETALWVKALERKAGCIKLDAKTVNSAKPVAAAVKRLAAAKTAKYAEKELNYTVKAMIVGVPNCGKSTIMNNMAGGAKAKVGNKPGVTRGRQWLKISDNFELMDTPGVLWGDLSNQATARRLAFAGCVKDEVTDTVALAKMLIQELAGIGRADMLIKRYKLDEAFFKESGFPETVFNKIALKRGCLAAGGVIDAERAAALILDEFRSGAMGKVTIERAE